MALLAIGILEQAFRDAEHEPRALAHAERLALGWLTTQRDEAGTVDGYMRFTEMDQMLEAWRRELRRRDREALAPEG
jgi:hypothetical protein